MKKFTFFTAGALAILILANLSLSPHQSTAGESTSDKAAQRTVFVNLVPRERAVLSAEVVSTVVDIRKEMGEIFSADEPLVTLDATIYAANRDKARAQVATAKAQLDNKQSLLVDGGSSITEVETARLNLATAQANLVMAEKEFAACTIKAPYEGRVVRVLVNRYETVQQGQNIIEIVNDRVLRAQFLIPSTALSTIRKGQTVTIAVFELGVSVEGTITHIGAVVDQASSKVKVFAEIPNENRTIRAGMRGSLVLSEPKQ